MVADTYDRWAELYAYIHGPPEEGEAYFERTVGRQLADRLELGGRVLDVGCGVGLSTAGLLAQGFDVVGIDISPKSLEIAATRLSRFDGKVDLIEGDALQLDEYAGTFDAVVAVSSLCEHFETEDDQKKLLTGLVKALKPGGTLLLDSYDHENIAASEAEDRVTSASLMDLPKGQALYTERRRYKGMPRDRTYEREFMYVGTDDTVLRLTMPARALFLREYSQWLMALGMAECRWLAPSETGYYKHMLTATKPDPSSRKNAETTEPATNRDSHHLVAKILPADLPPNIFEEEAAARRKTLVETVNDKGERVFERRNQATLVMFSGGIDSTYSLVKLLRESQDDILAHHIHFINIEGRHKAEALACQKIVEYLKRTERKFFYTESTIDRRRFKSFGMDEVSVGFEVGIVSRSFGADRGYPVDRWTSGICLEEELDDFGTSDIEQMQHALNSAAAAAFPQEPPRFFQLPIITKRDQMDYMGAELVDMCWTCRRPVWADDGQPQECGDCRTCLVMKDIRAGRPTIAEPDQ